MKCFACGGIEITIIELKNQINIAIAIIVAHGEAFNSESVIRNLSRMYFFLDKQPAQSDYHSVFDDKEFKLIMRSIFPSNPAGFSSYYSSHLSSDELNIVESVKKLLSNIYNEMPTI